MSYKTIPSFPLYEISEMGSVRRKADGKRLKGTTCKRKKNAYRVVNLGDEHGNRYTRYIHSLLLEAHVGCRPPGMVARHLDDDGLHNWLENLCWGTHIQNHEDQVRNGGVTPRREYCDRGHLMVGANVSSVQRVDGSIALLVRLDGPYEPDCCAFTGDWKPV